MWEAIDRLYVDTMPFYARQFIMWAFGHGQVCVWGGPGTKTPVATGAHLYMLINNAAEDSLAKA